MVRLTSLTEIFNLCCDIDHEQSNPAFSLDTLTRSTVELSLVARYLSAQKVYWKQSYSDYIIYKLISPQCDRDLEYQFLIFLNLHDTLAHYATTPKVRFQNTEQFRREIHLPDRHTDKWTQGFQYTPTAWGGGMDGGGGGAGV